MFLFLFFLLTFGQIRSLFTWVVQLFSAPTTETPNKREIWPTVLIQIPAYNEGWVIKDSVIAALKQDYPSNLLKVQVIDDSPEIDPSLTSFLQNAGDSLGVEFSYLRRNDRTGFKSGALNFGMRFSDHELIVILDADFIIAPDFLKRCVPLMEDKNLAGVQTRWTYRNQFENATTAIQSAVFENIFAFEQCFRVLIKAPALFTGTSGIWRRSVIEEIGGWREQPFTAEDIDLSFRSYHQGYGFAYIDENLASCEATPNYLAYKRQQQRWARGVFQAVLHNAGNIFNARQSKTSKILEATTLLYTFLPIVLLCLGAFSAAHVWLHNSRTPVFIGVNIITALLLLAGPASQGMAYAVKKYHPNLNFKQSFTLYKGMLLSIGLGWSIVFGIVEVLFRSKNEFVVTPKGQQINSSQRSIKKKLKQTYLGVFSEAITGCFFAISAWVAFPKYLETLPLFLLIASSGFASFRQSLLSLKNE